MEVSLYATLTFKICHNHSYLSQEPSALSSQLLPVRLANSSNALFEAPITPGTNRSLILISAAVTFQRYSSVKLQKLTDICTWRVGRGKSKCNFSNLKELFPLIYLACPCRELKITCNSLSLIERGILLGSVSPYRLLYRALPPVIKV